MMIYFDSVILIYLFDHTGAFQVRAANRLASVEAAGEQIALTDLSRLECRVQPIHLGDTAKLAVFDAFFARSDVQRLPLTTAVFDRATVIRATLNLKLGDSLHLAAALEAGCDRFLTNDTRLRRCTAIPVEVLP